MHPILLSNITTVRDLPAVEVAPEPWATEKSAAAVGVHKFSGPKIDWEPVQRFSLAITLSNIDNPLHIPVELQLLWTGTVQCIAVLWILYVETGRLEHQIRLRTVQRHLPLLVHLAFSQTILRLHRPEHCKDCLRSRKSPTERDRLVIRFDSVLSTNCWSITHHLFGCAIVGQATHPNDDLSALGQEWLGLIRSSTCYGQKVITRCSVNLYVSIADVMLVSFQGHVAVLLGYEPDQGLAVPSSLRW